MSHKQGLNSLARVDKGDPIKAEELSAISLRTSNSVLRAMAPLFFSETAGITTLYLKRQLGTGSSTAFPFKGYNKSVGTTGAFAVNANDGFAGTINTITPTLNSVTIGTNPTPTGSVTGNGVVYINCVLDTDLNITGTPTIEFSASMPAQTTGNAYVNLFNIVSYSATPTISFTINQSTINSLSFNSCNGNNIFFGA